MRQASGTYDLEVTVLLTLTFGFELFSVILFQEK